MAVTFESYERRINQILPVLKKHGIGSLEEAKKIFSFVDFVFNNENVGYFSGLNIGLKLLYDKGLEYDFIIIGNK